MNTTDKIINDVAVQLANKVIECANPRSRRGIERAIR